MISSIKGRLTQKSTNRIIVEVGGIGFDVQIPFSTYQTLPAIDEEVLLFIHTHFSEGAITLYGFYRSGEKNAFEMLISISKIGPKSALAILSGIPLNELKTAVIEKDIYKLSSVPGVGKKTAERIILELSDKKGFLSDIGDLIPVMDESLESIIKDVIAALEKLGFNERESNSAVRKVLEQKSTEQSIQSIIKESLKILK